MSESTTPRSTTSSYGVVLISFGKEIYHQSTNILIASIRLHNPNIPIAVITDKPEHQYYQSVNDVVRLNRELYHNRMGNFEPGRAKLAIYDLLPYERNLILDVDSYCLKDLQPLIDKLSESWKPYQTHMSGYLTKTDQKSQQNLQWARIETMWEHMKLKEEATLPAINSSIVFVRKCDAARSLYETALTLITDYPIPINKLAVSWGNTQPDELYMNASCAMHDYDPSMGFQAVFFGHGNTHKIADVQKQFYIISYYGGRGFTNRVYTDWINKLIRQELGMRVTFENILNQKHANRR